MAEEIQGGVCGGSWPWNSSRNLFGPSSCSSVITDLGSFGWLNNDLIMDMKTAASSISDDSGGSPSDGGGGSSIVLQEAQKPHQPTENGNLSIPSTLQMMGISLSSSITTNDWNEDLFHDSGTSEENYSQILQESVGLNSSMNYGQQVNFCQDSSFKQVNQSFPLEQQQPSNSFTTSASFPLDVSSYSYGSSSLLQTLFDTDSQPQKSSLNNQTTNYSSSSPNYAMNSNEYLPSLTKSSPMVKPSSFWNTTTAASGSIPASFLPSTKPQFLPSSLNTPKPNFHNFSAKHRDEAAENLNAVAKRNSNKPALKRPRIDTPSPLPTFKVRKEKLGDRVTALQQLVSPFGKTDTASVLHEAIEYIKFLHGQVRALSTPYLENGSTSLQRQQAADRINVQEGLIQDLRSRGLCLVPISSTFPVAAETTADFWTPTFGGSFR